VKLANNNKQDVTDIHSMSPKQHKRLSIEELKVLIGPIAKKHGVDKVYLFCSVARGDYEEDSDYDFCIERGKIKSLLMLAAFYIDVENAIKCKADILTMDALDPKFKNAVLTDGVVIYR